MDKNKKFRYCKCGHGISSHRRNVGKEYVGECDNFNRDKKGKLHPCKCEKFEEVIEGCKFCGCSDGHACLGGCHWVEPNVCSNCVTRVNQVHKELEAYLDDPDIKEVIVSLENKDGEITKLKVMKFNKKKRIV